MRARTLILLAVLGCALTVLLSAPARWLSAALPPDVQCTAQGTVWSGRCATLTVAGITLTEVRWRLRPLQLLRGALSLRLHSDDPRASADLVADVHRDGSAQLSDVQARVDVGAGLLPLFPDGWRGELEVALPRVDLKAGQLVRVSGAISAHNLHQQNPSVDLGSYELRFSEPGSAAGPEGNISGILRDLGGPLSVAGHLQLRPGGQYELEGWAATRAGADPQLSDALNVLGAPDGSGRRPFSLAGKF